MADFEQSVELSIEIPSRELSSARDELEGALSDIPVSVESGAAARSAPGGGAASRAGGGRGRRLQRWARQRTEDIHDILQILQNIDENLGDDSGGGSGRALRGGLGLGLLGGGLALGGLGLGLSRLSSILGGFEWPELDMPDLPPLKPPKDVPNIGLPPNVPNLGVPDEVPDLGVPNIPDLNVPDDIPDLGLPDIPNLGIPNIPDIDVDSPPFPIPIPVGDPGSSGSDSGSGSGSGSGLWAALVTGGAAGLTASSLAGWLTGSGASAAGSAASGGAFATRGMFENAHRNLERLTGIETQGPRGDMSSGERTASWVNALLGPTGISVGEGGETADVDQGRQTGTVTGDVTPPPTEVTVNNQTDVSMEQPIDKDAVVDEVLDEVERGPIEDLRREMERALRGV